jgi:CHAT domain-containing protein
MRVADVRVSLLAYFIGTDYVYCALHDASGREQLFRLAPCGDVLPRLEGLIEAIDGTCTRARREHALVEFARGWGRALLPPPIAINSCDVLVIIPQGALHGIPLHAIEPEDGAPPLALTHGVTYAPSGTLFVRCVDRNAARRFDPFAWTFPSAGGDGAPPRPRRCRAAAVDVKHHRSGEYEALARLFLEGFEEKRWRDGSRTSIKPRRHASDDDDDVICIVCHGHDDPRPGRSGLLLAATPFSAREMTIPIHYGEPHAFRDLPFHDVPASVAVREDCRPEILSVDELMVGCSTDAQLVALIGCSTAAGQTTSGDEFVSLANQFLKIGAATVLGSMWALDFEFASSWVPRFLHRWRDLREPKALSMRASLREELQGTPWPVSEWAVPALCGDWL